MLMPPPSVPALLVTRLLAIWMLCPQPCTKMPPPPCELLVMVRPSTEDGLHVKLLGNGLLVSDALLWQLALASPTASVSVRFAVVPESSVEPTGNPASAPLPNPSVPAGMFTPLERTVIPAPS